MRVVHIYKIRLGQIIRRSYQLVGLTMVVLSLRQFQINAGVFLLSHQLSRHLNHLPLHGLILINLTLFLVLLHFGDYLIGNEYLGKHVLRIVLFS